MVSLKIAFIIRFHYKKDDERFDWRFKFFKEEVLPRINSQSFKDFDVCVWCNSWHKGLFEELGVKTFHATYEKKDTKHFTDFTNWENVHGLEKYDVQIGLDSDDLVEPTLVETTVSLLQNKKGNVLISFQPIKIDIKSKKKYKMRNYKKTKRCSPCFAILQTDKTDYRFAYYRSHFKMNFDKWDEVLYVDNQVAMAIHHQNDSTIISKGDEEI